MKKIASGAIRFVLLCAVVPYVVSFFIYYQFATNYTVNVFSENGFKNQYYSGIYKYRALGREALLLTHEWTRRHGQWREMPAGLTELDPYATKEFYAAYYVLNTVFLCLACAAYFLVVRGLLSPQSRALEDLLVLASCLLMALGGFVVTPYDMLTFCFLFAGMGLLLKSDSPAAFAALCAVIAVGALARETVALLLALYVAIHFDKLKSAGLGSKESMRLYMLAASFLAPYLGLRLYYGVSQGFFDNVWFAQNIRSHTAWLGFGLFAALTALMLIDPRNRRECAALNLACAPYVIYMLVVGNPAEFRLWTPVIIMTMTLKLRGAKPTAGGGYGSSLIDY